MIDLRSPAEIMPKWGFEPDPSIVVTLMRYTKLDLNIT